MKRRSFLRHAIHSIAVPGVVGSMGFSMPSGRSMQNLLRLAADSDKALVMVFLEGGNDGLNTLIPLNRLSQLNKLRPHVALKEAELLALNKSDTALHPSLQGLKNLYDENRLQIIQNVGYPEQNFSHFRSTDIWMSGSESNQIVSSGWAGRNLEIDFPGYPDEFPNEDMEDPLSVEIGYGSSLLFQGVGSSMSVTLNSVDSFYELVENIEQEAPDSPAGDKLKYIRLIEKQSQLYGERIVDIASKVNNHVQYPSNNYLADQLKVVSKLIAGGSRTPLYLVRIGGFDTHDSQVEEENHSIGEHANLLTQLDEGISAFMSDLELHGVDDKVLGMTFSEFGRRVVSNASLGTDHGSAAPMFFFGNKVRGGVLGSNPVIDSQMTYYDNLSYQYDFRQLYGSVLEQWFGVDAGTRSNVLFNDFDTLDIIGEPILSAETRSKINALMVYPNPLNGMATVQFDGDGNSVSISLVDLQGRSIAEIFSGISKPGINKINWNSTSIQPGRYFILKRTKSGREVFSVTK